MRVTQVKNGKVVPEEIDAETVAALKKLDAERSRDYYKKNSAQVLARQKDRYLRDRGKIAKRAAAYYQRNAEKIKQRQRERRAAKISIA